MRARLALIFFVVAVFGGLAAPVASAAQPSTAAIPIPITGTLPGGGAFTGTYTLNSITAGPGGALQAVGTLTGTLTDAANNVIGTVTNVPVSLPLSATGSCQVLHLVLGPLDLNLLGLQVHLNQVVLDITAQSGPGNLLGNLLCAVAHLLDSSGSGTALSNLLNHILSLVQL